MRLVVARVRRRWSSGGLLGDSGWMQPGVRGKR